MAWGSMGNHSKTLGFPGFRRLWQVEGGRVWNKTGSSASQGGSLPRHCGGKMFVFCSQSDENGRKVWWKKCQTAYKPGSVPAPRGAMDDHSSGTSVAGRLARPTRAALAKTQPAAPVPCGTGRPAAPMRSCSRWGLQCRRRCRRRGALLPHPFTLTGAGPLRAAAGGLLSVALSLGSPPPGITRHRVSVEPGLSSTPPFPAKPRSSSRLARAEVVGRGRGVNRRRESLRRQAAGEEANRLPATGWWKSRRSQ
jgi:hypothetical protein